MMKSVLLISHFCDYGYEKSNNRFNYLADLLCENGFSVQLVTSSFSHRLKKQRNNTEPAKTKYKTQLIYEPGYSKNISFKRLFYSHDVFARNLKKFLRSCAPPDIIYCAVPSLSSAKVAADYAKKQGVKLVIDIQDLWPEAFRMVFRLPVISNLVFARFDIQANAIYKSADAICAVSETYMKRALSISKKCESGTAVFLGTDLAAFDKNVKEIAAPEKEKGEIWLAYCGTMGNSYDLRCVIDALALLENPPKFIALGAGQKKEEFERYAKEKNVDSVFTGLLPYEEMCAYLSACDITVNPIVDNSAASIINKHADYAAAGLPVINTQESPEYRKLVEDYGMGFNCRNGDAKDLAEKIKKLVEDEELRKQMGKNARKCAEEKFDRARTYAALVNVINREIDAEKTT